MNWIKEFIHICLNNTVLADATTGLLVTLITFTAIFCRNKIKHIWVRLFSKPKKEEARTQAEKAVLQNIEHLSTMFIEPLCQRINPANDKDAKKELVFSVLKAKLEVNEANWDGGHHILVLADAGMGKSTLLAMIRMKPHKVIPKNRSCVLLKINSDLEEQLKAIKNPSKVVLLLDALDEDAEAITHGFVKRLISIIQSTLSFYRVIITCRTQFIPQENKQFTVNRRNYNNLPDTLKISKSLLGKLKVSQKKPDEISFVKCDWGKNDHYEMQLIISGFAINTIYLSYFTDEQVDEYIDRMHQFNGITKQSITQIRALTRKIDDLRVRPLLLANIDKIIDRLPDITDNVYDIYEAIVDSWLYYEQRKPNAHYSHEQLLYACRLIAMQMLRTKKQTVSENEIQSLQEGVDLLRTIQSIDIFGRSFLNRREGGDFLFAHRTIQEFLVVFHLLNGSSHNNFSIKLSDQMNLFMKAFFSSEKRQKGNPSFSLNLNNISTLEKLNIRNKVFDNTSFQYSEFNDCIFTDCTFVHCSFNNAVAPNCKFVKCNFQHTDLDCVNFEKTVLEECTFIEN
jgi:hypothetical protein